MNNTLRGFSRSSRLLSTALCQAVQSPEPVALTQNRQSLQLTKGYALRPLEEAQSLRKPQENLQTGITIFCLKVQGRL